MKYDCELIQDIMPLYKDNALSDKSKKIVDEHLSECAECRNVYKMSSSDESSPNSQETSENSVKFEKYSKKIKKLRIGIVAAVLVVFLTLTASFVSYLKFDSPNFFAAGIGLIRITLTDTQYVEIQNSPRVIIAKPQNSMQLFLDTVESEGYTYLADEQMGGMHVIEKDGKKEHVFFSANGYFSKWSWE